MIRYLAILLLLATQVNAQGLGIDILPDVPVPDLEQPVQPEPEIVEPEPVPESSPLQQYETGMLCGPSHFVRNMMEAAGKKIFVTGTRYPQDPGIFEFTALLINAKTGEYSFVFIAPQFGMTCIVHQGTGLRLISPDSQ